LPENYVQFAKWIIRKIIIIMKVAPTVADIMKGFPKEDHQIDAIPGKPKQLSLNILIEALTENAASIATLNGGGLFGHTAFYMSPAEYYMQLSNTV